MSFSVGTMLWGLVVVAAVAAWALLRPARQRIVVPSLAIWQAAVDSLASSRFSVRRRPSLHWWAALLGATLAVLAAAGPSVNTSRPIRKVAIVLIPSAEMNPQSLHESTLSLLRKFQASDEIYLALPADFSVLPSGDSTEKLLGRWHMAGELVAELSDSASWIFQRRTAPLRRVELPVLPADVQHAYVISCATSDYKFPIGPNVTRLELLADLPAVTFDALAAEQVAGDTLSVFLSLRNHTNQPWNGMLAIRRQSDKQANSKTSSWPVTIQAGQIASRSISYQVAPHVSQLQITLSGKNTDAKRPFLVAWLEKQTRPHVRVTMIGKDDPLLRKYIQSDPAVTEVASVGDSDLIIANVTALPPEARDKPALLIDPPKPPAGWAEGKPLQHLALRDASLSTDDPVINHVNWTAAAVREVTPWRCSDVAVGRAVATINGDALIVRTTPETSTTPQPRRVFLAFDLAAENTNLVTDEAYVVLLANCVRWLTEWKGQATQWVYRSGSEVVGSAMEKNLPLGLRAGPTPPSMVTQLGKIQLPTPRPMQKPIILWPILAIAAGLCWMVSWWLRLRD